MELRKEMTGVSDDMGMLIRDIHEAEVVREQNELVQAWFEYVNSEAGQKIITDLGLILPQ